MGCTGRTPSGRFSPSTKSKISLKVTVGRRALMCTNAELPRPHLEL